MVKRGEERDHVVWNAARRNLFLVNFLPWIHQNEEATKQTDPGDRTGSTEAMETPG